MRYANSTLRASVTHLTEAGYGSIRLLRSKFTAMSEEITRNRARSGEDDLVVGLEVNARYASSDIGVRVKLLPVVGDMGGRQCVLGNSQSDPASA